MISCEGVCERRSFAGKLAAAAQDPGDFAIVRVMKKQASIFGATALLRRPPNGAPCDAVTTISPATSGTIMPSVDETPLAPIVAQDVARAIGDRRRLFGAAERTSSAQLCQTLCGPRRRRFC